ncbi:hypothetical protein [Demequina silvatica]|nr:hypothetical protein [Demequina silvatica]
MSEAKSAVLKALVKAIDDGYQGEEIKQYALAYRLLHGGPQPGASVLTKE